MKLHFKNFEIYHISIYLFYFILFFWSGRGAPGKCTRSP